MKTTNELRMVPIADLVPYANNARTHSPAQIAKLRASLREFGFVNPVIIDKDNGIIAGHGRVEAARLEGFKEVPCVPAEYLTEAQRKAYILADNRMALDAGWDEQMLKEELEALEKMGFDLPLTGFEDKELDKLLGETAKAIDGADELEEAPEEPFTQRGDIWVLGRHRVMCGDSTHPQDRELLLDGAKPEILFTDPPYCSGGFQEAGKSIGSIGSHRDGKIPRIANDTLSTRGYQSLIRSAIMDIPCLYAYVFTDWRMWVSLYDIVEAEGFSVRSMIVWDKGTPGMGVGWRSQHELILFGSRGALSFNKRKGYGNVLKCSRSGNEYHPTQKPVELLEKIVDNMDFAHGVYDPFGGSGSTLIACEAHGQPSYLMELTPGFTDAIVKRYVRTTGKKDIKCIRKGAELPQEEIAPVLADIAK